MTFSDTQLYRELLLTLRAHLRGEINLLVDIALDVAIEEVLPRPSQVCRSCRPIWRARASQTMKRYIQRLIDAKEKMLALVEIALSRMDNGTYGVCAHCGAALPKQRLVTAPYTTSCVTCNSHRPPSLDWRHVTNQRLCSG